MAASTATADEPPRHARRWPRRLGWTLLAVFVATVLVGTLFLRFSVRRAFPDPDGTVTISGLTGDVEILRDQAGIPHIYADTPEDLFVAQGYVHAQDRFFQMDFWRHISYGRLAEMFGSSQLETDAFLRTMGWGRLAESQYAEETEEHRRYLDAYADGVNAYESTNSPAELSFEYTIIELLNHGYDPEPWTGPQSLAWGKVMSWDLGGNLSAEIERAMELATMDPERVAQLWPPYPGDRHPYIVDVGASNGPTLEAALAIPPEALTALRAAHRTVDAIDAVAGAGSDAGIGSNSWAVSGSHSPTGAPMLMNDPHLSSQMPSIWYQVGLHCRNPSPTCPFDVVGFSFAGVPGVIIGHNADIAWGFTNTGPDVQDLYIEKINPDDPNQYEFGGEWLDMEVRTESITVAGGDDITIDVRSTVHGPIISGVYEPLDDFDGSGIDTPEPYAVALRWTALDDVPSIAGPLIGMNTASSFDEFRAAGLLFSVPAQNLLYADREGNIGYQMPGLIPVRSAGDGTVPVPGWTGEYEWDGYIPFDELPWVHNPESGWIVTANNAVVDDTYPYLITTDWTNGYRARRIVDMVGPESMLTLDDHAKIQLDAKDLNAEFLRPFVVSALSTRTDGASETETDAEAAVRSWDLQDSLDSAGAAVWNATWRHLLALTFHDDIPEEWWPEGGDRWFEVVRGLVERPDDPFWDDVTTSEVEDRDQILTAAFVAGVAEVNDLLGGSVDNWRWGDIHTVTFENQSLGTSGIALIEDRFNSGPHAVGGSKSVVDAVGWDADEGYEVDWVPSMRMLVDLGDLSRSRSINTTGQSGHVDHPNYDDMIDPWISGDDFPMLWNRADIEAAAVATLVLTPDAP